MYTWQALGVRGVFLGDVCVLLGRSLYLGSFFVVWVGNVCMNEMCVFIKLFVCAFILA